MRNYLSIIMSLLLAVQPAFGVFEGVKQKAVSVKEAIARSRAVLKENWQCFRYGTGPNCTKEQRSALRIIHDFVVGKWIRAREQWKEFYREHGTAVQLSAGITVALLAVIAIVVTFIGGLESSEEFD